MRWPNTHLKKVFYFLMIDQRVMHLWSFYYDIELDHRLTEDEIKLKQNVIMDEIAHYDDILIELMRSISYDEIFRIKREYNL